MSLVFCNVNKSLIKILTDTLYDGDLDKLYMYKNKDCIMWLENYVNENLNDIYDMNRFKIIFLLSKNNLLEATITHKNMKTNEILNSFTKICNDIEKKFNSIKMEYDKYKNVFDILTKP